ncbi:response regulator transcription factor [Clostridium sp. DL1XJH146]
MELIKVLIVDDQTLMRDGLKTIIELEDNMEVVGTSKNGLEAIEFCKNNKPDVVLMDIRMPGVDGVEATKIIKSQFPSIVILILTTFNEDDYIVDALSNGATGYLLKDIEGDALIKAIKDAHKGAFMLPSEVAIKIAKKLSKNSVVSVDDKKNLEDFSEREIEIAKMLALGFTNKQIASSLFISIGTVKNYISTIYSKLGTSDRMAAAMKIKKALNL